jgi:hypothetical protein
MRLLEHCYYFLRQEIRRQIDAQLPAASSNLGNLQLLPGILRRPNSPLQTLLAPGKRDSTTPGPRQLPAPVSDLSKATCFNYSKVGHFANSCPELQTSLRIYEISQDTEASSSKALDKDADSKSEN